MPLDQSVMDELKDSVAVARKRELAFGLCIGKSAETTLLVCHKTKDPETLGRQAKKDGETSKVTFGMMKVEGKNLNLSCQGDIPAGIARKTREMLKLANLNLKVRVLDPTGNAVEEDGDEEQDGEEQGGEEPVAAADPLAEEWAAAKSDTRERIKAVSTLPEARSLVADFQTAVGLADNGDLRGALNALETLNRRIDEAETNAGQVDADKTRWEQSRAKLEPAVRDAVAINAPASPKVKLAWDFMLGKVNGTPPDYAAAVKAIATLVGLIQEARAGTSSGPVRQADTPTMTTTPQTGGTTPPTTPPTGTQPQPTPPQPTPPQPQAPQTNAAPTDAPPPPKQDASEKERFDYAEALLKQADALVDAYMALIPGSTEPRPASWVSARGKIDAVLAPMRGPGKKIDVKRVGEAVKGIDLLIGVIKTKTDEKAAWKTTLELVNARLVPLDRHPEAASAPQVAPKIAAIRTDLAKTTVKANAQDFKGAQSAAQPLIAKGDVVEKLADDFAHYKAILTQRRAIVTAMGANTGDKEVDKLKSAVTKLLSDAEKLATKEKYAEAIAKLDQMPVMHDEFRRLSSQQQNYSAYETGLTGRFNAIDAMDAEVRAPFLKQIKGWKAEFEKGKHSKTKDYGASMRVMQNLWGLVCVDGWLDKDLKSRQAYIDAKTDFDAQYDIFKPHKGRVGIEDFYQQMDRDRTQALSEASGGKYSTAAAILKRSEAEWPAQETLADDCLAYITKRDEVAKVIAGLKGKAGAESGVSQAEALMASAVTLYQAKSFPEAKASVEEAERRATAAQAGADAKKDLDGAKDGAALNGIAADIDKAIGVYTAMRAKVAGRDDGTFAADLGRADTEAQKARDEKAKPAPNFAAARQGLDAAIAILEATLPKIMAKAGYDGQLQEVNGLKGQLPGLNADNCIQTRITRINGLVTTATNAALAPGLDFPAACAQLTTARGDANKAIADAALWPEIKTNRAAIDTAKTNIEAEASAAALMGPTLTKLTTAMTAVDTKVTAEDFKAALALAKTGAAAAAKTAADLVTAQAIVSRHHWWYVQKTGPAAGKVPGPNGATKAASQVSLMNSKYAAYQTALNAGNYDAATGLLQEVSWAIDAALRILVEYDAYEIARAAAEVRLNALRLVRNDGTEDAVKALEKRYDDAVALSNGEKHKPAETAMLKLPADCDALILKANDWKAYDDALKAAQTKITEMETHAQAVAIRPAATALRGKVTGAVATASKGEFKTAKTLLDTVATEAVAALNTANAAGAVITEAGQIGTGVIDPALIGKAQTLYDQLALKPDAAAAKADLDIAKTRINIAKDSKTTSENARTALKDAMEACTRAQVTISQMQVIREAIASVKVEVGTLKSHAQTAYIAPEIAKIEADLKAVEDDAGKSGPDVVGNRIRTVEERCAAAKVLADKHQIYLDLRAEPQVEPRLEQLERHDHRFAVKPTIDAFRKKLVDAAKLSAAKNPAAAIMALQEAKSLAQTAWVSAEMRANRTPTTDDVKAIVEGPGGDKALDEMLKTLDPDAQREVIKVAFEARFGVKLETFTQVSATGDLENPTAPGAAGALDGPNLKRFYDLMIKLPKDHVVNNDSMRKFSSVEDGGNGSYYSDTKKDVVMREGDAALSGAYGFGRDFEVGGADENCKPANDEEVTFFSWNTLHEVGHAVDDKLSYMNRNGAADNHGGWTSHGKDTQAIATAIVAHFKYDATYIGQFLSKATPPVPPKPGNVTEEEWDARRVAFEAWAKSAFEGTKPWTSNSNAAKLAIGGVVYQESYPGTWTCYKVAARKQGMTGYQFRAPGEWFAELYAAYHSQKLKPTHPAASWLATL